MFCHCDSGSFSVMVMNGLQNTEMLTDLLVLLGFPCEREFDIGIIFC